MTTPQLKAQKQPASPSFQSQGGSPAPAKLLDSVDVQVPLNTDEENESIRAKFRKALSEDIVLQGNKLVENAINTTTESKAYFRKEDIVRAALKRAQKEVDEDVLEKDEFEQYIRWLVSVRDFHQVGKTGYVTTHEMWTDEMKVIDLAGYQDPVYIQPEDVVLRAIDRKKGISDEQSRAVEAAARSPNRVTVIEGTAGAGKSFTMEAVKEIYLEQGYHVMGTALGWAAAKVLGESAKLEDENCKAIEGLTRQWLAARANNTDAFQGPTLLIVDEAGMVGTKHMSIILEETARSQYPVKVVLTGDSLQVVPVAAGNALEAIIELHGTTRINTIRRQHQASHRRAVLSFSKEVPGPALHTFLQQEAIHWCKDEDMLLNMVVRNYISYRLAHPNKKALVLTLSNKDVLELNFRIRAAYKKLGLIAPKDAHLTVNNGKDVFETDFSEGDEVLLRANDKNLLVYEIDHTKSPAEPETWKPIRMGVFNRNAGRIVHIRRSRNPIGSYDFVIDLAGDTPGRVLINSDKFRSSDGKQGMPMLHNYAGTIYGSQGQTVAQVFLIDNPRMDFRLAYVGASRHKEGLDIYLNETELHRRLDNVMGRRQSLESHVRMQKEGKSMDDAKVEIGRYSRSTMLKAVSRVWGKHSENLTAFMFEKIRRTSVIKANADLIDANSEIRPADPSDLVVDFSQEFNVPYPLVDVAKILDLPDPIEESELVRPSDVDENKKRYGTQEMPVDAEGTPLPMSDKVAPKRTVAGRLPTHKEEENSYFGSAMKWLLRDDNPPTLNTPQAPKPCLRQSDPVSAFEGVEGVDASVPVPQDDRAQSLFKKTLKSLNQWINPEPKVKIPYLPNSAQCGKIEFPEFDPDIEKVQRSDQPVLDPRPHYLSFEGVPTPANITGGPDREWVASQKDRLWAIGRFGEPRILALNPKGVPVARYRLNGDCVVGEGQAPIILNKHALGKGPIPAYIVAGAKEWLWLRETMESKYSDDPMKIPHIIWGAKDVDWGLMEKSLKSKAAISQIVIVRSKADDRQIPWAVSLQKILWERYQLQTVISPAVPEDVLEKVLSSLASPQKTTTPAAPLKM